MTDNIGYEIVTEDLPAFRGDVVLVELDEDRSIEGTDEKARFFVVSSIEAQIVGRQTVAFAAEEDGTPINFRTQAGGDGYTREETLDELTSVGGAGE